MNQFASGPSREDVLDAFAVEPNHEHDTLERYLRDYPQYAAELVDLSRELSRVIFENKEPLSAEDQTLIEVAWKRHLAAAPKAIADPFAALSPVELREIAKRLDVPRQIVTAFRERRVVSTSVPRGFLVRFATALNTTIELLLDVLAVPPAQGLARSYKADVKPTDSTPVTFERLLIDAGVPEEKRSRLMSAE